MSIKQYLETGKIVGTHGVKGELKLEVWSDSPDLIKNLDRLYFEEGKKEIKPLASRVHKNHLLMTLDGIDTIEKADELRGKIVYLNRDDVKLEDGRYFLQDIIGLTVKHAKSGRIYGKVIDVLQTRANDVYEIEDETGKKYLFPAVAPMIEKTDIENGVIEIKPIDGIFDNE